MKKKKNHHQEGRSSSSCAACKLLKRRCVPNCQFAPYFRSDEPKKFAKVHKVFGASNVSKILNEVPEEQREDTVNSLVYEAEVRLRDPVYGCIGAIASLQRKMVELQHHLLLSRARLAAYCANTTKPTPSSSSSSSCSLIRNIDHDHHVDLETLLDFDRVPSGLFVETNFDHNLLAGDHHQGEFMDQFGHFPFP